MVDELAALGPMTMEEVLAVLDGESLDDARRKMALNADLHAEGTRYRDLPPSEWPTLIFNWDLSEDSQQYALDGVKAIQFQQQYPGGLQIGWVNLVEFDIKLCHFSRRAKEELWSVGCASKLAKTIAYLSRGLPITPPLVAPVKGKEELVFRGGNHRYAALKATNFDGEFPIYIAPDNFEAVKQIVKVRSNPIVSNDACQHQVA